MKNLSWQCAIHNVSQQSNNEMHILMYFLACSSFHDLPSFYALSFLSVWTERNN